MSVNVAVVGATGAVGDLMRQVLAERGFPVKSIKFLASEKCAGKTVEFAGKPYTVELIRPEAFAGVQIVLSSTPGSVSKEYCPIAAKAGAIVVDNSSAWRMDPDCPLVVPEVNADELHHIKKGIVANPNCVAIPLCVALKPLHDLGEGQAGRRLHLPVVLGQGGEGAGRLRGAAGGVGRRRAGPGPDRAPRRSSPGNVLTLDWTLDPNGYTEEENKVINETKKILGDATIGVCPTCVRVPVKVAHSEAITVEFDRPRVGRRREGGAGEGARHRAHGRDEGRSSRSRSTPRGATTRSSAACGRTRATRTRCACGSSPTTSARGRRRTPCSARRNWSQRGIVK